MRRNTPFFIKFTLFTLHEQGFFLEILIVIVILLVPVKLFLINISPFYSLHLLFIYLNTLYFFCEVTRLFILYLLLTRLLSNFIWYRLKYHSFRLIKLIRAPTLPGPRKVIPIYFGEIKGQMRILYTYYFRILLAIRFLLHLFLKLSHLFLLVLW